MATATQMRVSTLLARANVLAGARAKREDRPVTACPYDPRSPKALERFKARYWIKGWNRSLR